jgi:hypothetical protein
VPLLVPERLSFSGRGRASVLGDFFADVGTIIAHPADDVDVIVHLRVDDVIDAIQGAPIVGGLAPDVRSFVHGPLRDFAKSPLGAIVLTSVTMGAAAALPFLGPQLAFFAYATPGFIEGGSFGQSWLAGYVDYIKRGVKFLSQNQVDLGLPDIDIPPELAQEFADYSQKIQDGVKTAVDYLHGLAPDVLSGLTYDGLVAKLGIRYDSAVWALANARGNMAELLAAEAMHFDPATGLPISAAAWAARSKAVSSVEAANARGASIIVAEMHRLEHYAAVPHTAQIAGKYLPSASGPATPTAAAVADGAVRAASSSSTAPLVAAGVVVLAGAFGALWWFKWRRRR